MAKVFIPAWLWNETDDTREIELPGSTVREVLMALEQRFPLVVGRLRDGKVMRAGLCVSVDSKVIHRGLNLRVSPESEVHFVLAISGG